MFDAMKNPLLPKPDVPAGFKHVVLKPAGYRFGQELFPSEKVLSGSWSGCDELLERGAEGRRCKACRSLLNAYNLTELCAPCRAREMKEVEMETIRLGDLECGEKSISNSAPRVAARAETDVNDGNRAERGCEGCGCSMAGRNWRARFCYQCKLNKDSESAKRSYWRRKRLEVCGDD